MLKNTRTRLNLMSLERRDAPTGLAAASTPIENAPVVYTADALVRDFGNENMPAEKSVRLSELKPVSMDMKEIIFVHDKLEGFADPKDAPLSPPDKI